MRNFIFTAMAALIGIGSAQAEDHFYVGPAFTYNFMDESRYLPGEEDATNTQLGIHAGYEFGERYAAEIAAGASLGDSDLDTIELSLYNFFSTSRQGITPYLVFGVKQMQMDASEVRSEETHNAVLGFGIANTLADNADLRLDARLSNALDDVAAGDNAVDLGIRLALNYHFGTIGSSAAPAAAVAAPAPIPVVERVPERAAPPAPAPMPAPMARSITVELEVLFEFNSAVVAEAGEEMAQMAAALASQPDLELTLEGHTDSVGDAGYNQSLSQRRVDAVKAELVNTYGAPADRIEAIGYGESRPIADNGTADGRAQNRRVVGVLTFEAAQ